MVDTIESALHIFSIASFIFGYDILRYPYGQSRFYLSILYMLILWSVYAYIFSFVITFHLLKNKTILYEFVGFFVILTSLFVALISVITAIRKYEQFNTCIRKLGLVDNTLEKLGIPKEYHKIRNSIKWIFVIWFITMCITRTADAILCEEKLHDIKGIIVPMVYNYSININHLMDIKFMFLLRYVGSRLDKINDYVGQFSETESYGLRCILKKPHVFPRHYVQSAQTRKRILLTAMHLHSDLCRIARYLNGLFGIQLTLEMFSYFSVFTIVFYMQYGMIFCLQQGYRNNRFKLESLISSNIWCIIYITNLILLNYTCENVSAKAEKTKHIIYKLTNLICFSEAREEMWQFIMQISVKPLKFSGIGLFYFGYSFIHKFSAWVLAVIIFMVQIDSILISQMKIYGKNNNITLCDS